MSKFFINSSSSILKYSSKIHALEKNIISSEQLDEALIIHWRKGICLGEILEELGFLKEKDLKEALEIQKTTASDSKETKKKNNL